MTQNSISLPLLSLKIMKSAPRNPLIESFLAIPRAHSSFPKFLKLYFVKKKIDRIVQYLIILSNHYETTLVHPCSLRAFQ
jgi:hypothetical protein